VRKPGAVTTSGFVVLSVVTTAKAPVASVVIGASSPNRTLTPDKGPRSVDVTICPLIFQEVGPGAGAGSRGAAGAAAGEGAGAGLPPQAASARSSTGANCFK
jgi:hypothetical protein